MNVHAITSTFEQYPELLVFLTLAVGFLIGKVHWKTIALGSVTGTLVAGLVLGQIGVEVTGPLKAFAFLAFLFALGYRVGPVFFRGLKRDGLPQVGLALIVCVTGLGVCYLFAKIAGYDPGLGAGMLGGALTQSAVIGVAQDAIGQLPGLSDAARTDMANIVPVAYAVTYVLGTILCALFLANVAPRLLGVDLAEESRRLEQKMKVEAANADLSSAYYDVVLRSYELAVDTFDGRTVAEAEKLLAAHGGPKYITRVRTPQGVTGAVADTVLHKGDVVALTCRRENLLELEQGEVFGPETADRELLDYANESLDVIISRKGGAGRTIGELRTSAAYRAVYLEKVVRQGESLPLGHDVKLHPGDTITLTGPEDLVERVAKEQGTPARTSETADVSFMTLGVFLGGLIGIPALHFAGVPLALSTSGGALIMGLVFGWLHGRNPRLGHCPKPTLWLLDTGGLCLFVGVVGLNAGPSFVSGLKQAGVGLFLWGAIATMVPLIVGLYVGRYIFKMEVPILLGVLAGAQTTTAAIGAITESAKSRVPVLGYTVPYAVGNVLLTLWGVLMVALLH
ncbi:aspartate-alanine antiporter [Streptomyces sp. NPDC048659]|uniref:aspartate-alanine antiporter n=1 Tax=Streptomyces sp. NPDC048659 TaxID=3155489 RepID=UPI0034452674